MHPSHAPQPDSRAHFQVRNERSRGPADLHHSVHFYENDHFLVAAVADFLAEGLATQEPIVIIATEEHRSAFAARLRAKGLNVERKIQMGRITLLDAQETLAQFMDGDRPDAERFQQVVGGVIERTIERRRHRAARAYGEMVDILWRDGNTDGAVRLEEMWNDLARTHSFSLMCAYALGHFYKTAHTGDLEEISQLHSHVVMEPRLTTTEDRVQQSELRLLQERTRALEAEIEHRKELEKRLREALLTRQEIEEALQRSEEQLQRLAAEHARLSGLQPAIGAG